MTTIDIYAAPHPSHRNLLTHLQPTQIHHQLDPPPITMLSCDQNHPRMHTSRDTAGRHDPRRHANNLLVATPVDSSRQEDDTPLPTKVTRSNQRHVDSDYIAPSSDQENHIQHQTSRHLAQPRSSTPANHGHTYQLPPIRGHHIQTNDHQPPTATPRPHTHAPLPKSAENQRHIQQRYIGRPQTM
jgi:hypothetical protein